MILAGAGEHLIIVRARAVRLLGGGRIEQPLGGVVRNAGLIKTVDALEVAHGALRAGAVDAVHSDGVVAQILQPLLELIDRRKSLVAAHKRGIRARRAVGNRFA